ncbi:hypothetical protein H920_10402 [Fukomys damarensis]|uniref:Uncharacterized protein n=1 Tax=Fukomys damarensis TaxID=885580 RepID=A0A091DCH6_FUKDA|nr:hypothetical protein H920_10402 [Fukomys damarensis]
MEGSNDSTEYGFILVGFYDHPRLEVFAWKESSSKFVGCKDGAEENLVAESVGIKKTNTLELDKRKAIQTLELQPREKKAWLLLKLVSDLSEENEWKGEKLGTGIKDYGRKLRKMMVAAPG